MPSIEPLQWDSEFFGIKIGQVRLSGATPEELAAAVAAADLDAIECLYWLVGCEDRRSAIAAQACGFCLVDVRITFDKALIGSELDSLASATEPNVPPVRLFVNDDLPAILKLTRQSYRDTRFFCDGNFNEDKCMAMYEQWVQRAVQTRPDLIFVTGPQGEPSGYFVCHMGDDQIGKMGLMTVDPRWRGTGLGRALVGAVVRHFAGAGMRSVTGATQGRNIVMQRLFQKCGFVTRSVELWYHRWAARQPHGSERTT
jgi:dTDP-4-amino-4,6-dideoxy-D-galactose acyltransferase